jgi:hypothetical protein
MHFHILQTWACCSQKNNLPKHPAAMADSLDKWCLCCTLLQQLSGAIASL